MARPGRSIVGSAITVLIAIVLGTHTLLMIARVVPWAGLWHRIDAAAEHVPSRLRLYSRWDMFAMRRKKPTSGSTYVMSELVLHDGRKIPFADHRDRDKSMWDRAADRRMRKFIRRLGRDGERRVYGKSALKYLCGQALAMGYEAKRVAFYEVRVAGDRSRGRLARRKRLASRGCWRDRSLARGDSPALVPRHATRGS